MHMIGQEEAYLRTMRCFLARKAGRIVSYVLLPSNIPLQPAAMTCHINSRTQSLFIVVEKRHCVMVYSWFDSLVRCR